MGESNTTADTGAGTEATAPSVRDRLRAGHLSDERIWMHFEAYLQP